MYITCSINIKLSQLSCSRRKNSKVSSQKELVNARMIPKWKGRISGVKNDAENHFCRNLIRYLHKIEQLPYFIYNFKFNR